MKKLFIIICLYGTSSLVIAQEGNTHLGGNAGNAGNHNTSIGHYSGSLVTGNYNTFLGSRTGYYMTSGTYNTFLGFRSGYASDGTYGNVYLGAFSGNNNAVGRYNVFLGAYTGTNSVGYRNVFIGYNVGANETGSDKLYIDNSPTTSPLIYGDFNQNLARINGKFEVSTEAGASRAPTFIMASNHTNLTGVNSSLLLVNRDKTDGNWARLHFFTANTEDVELGGISLAANYTSHTAGNESADFVIATRNNGLYTEKIRVKSNGYLGIGTDSPSDKLHIYNATGVTRQLIESGDNSSSGIHIKHSGHTSTIGLGQGANIFKINNSGDFTDNHIAITENGNVGIGTISTEARLAVNGVINAKEVNVTIDGWPDFVFDEGYELAALSEVEEHIQENKRLPGIPSANEVKKDGVDLGEMDALLLRKIEELTLYVIRQNKRIQSQDQQIRQLSSEIQQLKTLIK